VSRSILIPFWELAREGLTRGKVKTRSLNTEGCGARPPAASALTVAAYIFSGLEPLGIFHESDRNYFVMRRTSEQRLEYSWHLTLDCLSKEGRVNEYYVSTPEITSRDHRGNENDFNFCGRHFWQACRNIGRSIAGVVAQNPC
jgi:hypothetical protein